MGSTGYETVTTLSLCQWGVAAILARPEFTLRGYPPWLLFTKR